MKEIGFSKKIALKPDPLTYFRLEEVNALKPVLTAASPARHAKSIAG